MKLRRTPVVSLSDYRQVLLALGHITAMAGVSPKSSTPASRTACDRGRGASQYAADLDAPAAPIGTPPLAQPDAKAPGRRSRLRVA